MNERRINSIDIARLLCAVLVVAIHTQAITYFPDLPNGNIQILTRIAVPFFFCTSGYFLQQRYHTQGENAIAKALVATARLYILLSAVYFTIIFLENPTLLNRSKKWLLMDFLFNGSYYHLWYLVAVIYSYVALYIACRLNLSKFLFPLSVVLYVIGLLGTSYYAIGCRIPVLCLLFDSGWFQVIRRVFLMGIPFTVLGWTIAEGRLKTCILKKFPLAAALAVTAVIFTAEIIGVTVIGISRSIEITLFLYPLLYSIFLLCLSHPLERLVSLGSICKSTADYTYFWHPIMILLLGNAIQNRVLLFAAVSAACILLGCVFYGIRSMLKRKRKVHECFPKH